MEIDKAIRVITYQIFHPDKVEESCRILLEEIRRMAKPINVEKGRFLSTLDYGIVYNREKGIIHVDPIVFASNLRDEHKETGVSYKELIWYFIEHEKGHFELQQLGLEPTLPKNEIYMTLYARFEDYVISHFLRRGKYVEIEREVLRAESKRGVRTFNDICVSALYIALGYGKLGELQFSPNVLKYISMVSSGMQAVKRPIDAPEVVHKLNSELAREDWKKFFLNFV